MDTNEERTRLGLVYDGLKQSPSLRRQVFGIPKDRWIEQIQGDATKAEGLFNTLHESGEIPDTASLNDFLGKIGHKSVAAEKPTKVLLPTPRMGPNPTKDEISHIETGIPAAAEKFVPKEKPGIIQTFKDTWGGIKPVVDFFRSAPEKDVPMPDIKQWENQNEIKQSASSPVFKDQKVAQAVLEDQDKAGNRQAAPDGLIFQTKDALKRGPVSQAAIEGSTGHNLAKEADNSKRSMVEKIGDFGSQVGAMGESIFRNTEQGLWHLGDYVPRNVRELVPGTPEADEAWLRHNQSHERLYKASEEIEKDFREATQHLNIETSVIDAVKEGNLNRLPEAVGYSVAQAGASIIPALFTGGASMFAQTLPNAYAAGVKEIAEKEGITPEQVISEGRDARLVAGLSTGVQTLLENVSAGIVSKSIASKGGYKYIRDIVIEGTGNRAWSRAAGIAAGVGTQAQKEALVETTQELTGIAAEQLAASNSAKNFYDNLTEELSTPEAQKRLLESASGGFFGAGGLIVGGKAAGAAIRGKQPPTQLGGIPTVPAPDGPEFTPTEQVAGNGESENKEVGQSEYDKRLKTVDDVTFTDYPSDKQGEIKIIKDGKEIGNMDVTYGSDGFLHINWVKISKEHQGKGLSLLLYGKATEIAKQKGLGGVYSGLVTHSTDKTQGVYKHFDLTEKGDSKGSMQEGVSGRKVVLHNLKGVEPVVDTEGSETVTTVDEGVVGGGVAQSDADIETGQQRSGFQFQSPIAQLPQEAQSIIQSAAQGKLVSLEPVKALMDQLYDQYQIYSKQAESTSRNLTIPQIQQGMADYEQAMTVLGEYINKRDGGEFMQEFAAKKKAEPTVVPGGEWIEESADPDPITKLQALGLSLPEIAALSPEQQQAIISESEGVSTGATPSPATDIVAPTPENPVVAQDEQAPPETLPISDPIGPPPLEADRGGVPEGPSTEVGKSGGLESQGVSAEKVGEDGGKAVTPVRVNGIIAIDENGDIAKEFSDKIEQLKKDNDKEGLNEIYSTVRILLNGVAQSKGEKTVAIFEGVKKDLEDYGKSIQKSESLLSKEQTKTQPNVSESKPALKNVNKDAWGEENGITDNFYTTDVDGYAIKKPITNPSNIKIDGIDFHIARVDGDWKVIEKKSGLELSTGKTSNTKQAAIDDATYRLKQNGGAENLPKLVDRAIQGFKDRNSKAVEPLLSKEPANADRTASAPEIEPAGTDGVSAEVVAQEPSVDSEGVEGDGGVKPTPKTPPIKESAETKLKSNTDKAIDYLQSLLDETDNAAGLNAAFYRTAIKGMIAAIKAGKTVANAISEAIDYLVGKGENRDEVVAALEKHRKPLEALVPTAESGPDKVEKKVLNRAFRGTTDADVKKAINRAYGIGIGYGNQEGFQKGATAGMKAGFQSGSENTQTRVKNIISEALAEMKGSLTPKQIQQILNGIPRVFTAATHEKFSQLVENIIEDSNYVDRVSTIAGKQKQLRKKDFGNHTSLARQFLAINPREIPIDKLSDYEQALDGLSQKKVPDVKVMNAVYNDIMDEIDPPATRDELDALVKQVATLEETPINTLADYEAFSTALAGLDRTLNKLVAQGEITEKDAADIREAYNKAEITLRDGTKADVQKQVTALKTKMISDAKQLSADVDMEGLTPLQKEMGKRLMQIPVSTLQDFTPGQLDAYQKAIVGLSNGFINTATYDLIKQAGLVERAIGVQAAVNKIGEQKEFEERKTGLRKLLSKWTGPNFSAPDKITAKLIVKDKDFWDSFFGTGNDKPVWKKILSPIMDAVDKALHHIKVVSSDYYKATRGAKQLQKDRVALALIQMDYESNPSVLKGEEIDHKDIPTSEKDYYRYINDKLGSDSKVSPKEKKRMKTAWDSMPKDADGNLDTKAYMDSLSPKEREIMNSVRKVYDEAQDYVRINTEKRGEPFKQRENYANRLVRQRDLAEDPSNAEFIEQVVGGQQAGSPIRLRQGATHGRTGDRYYVTYDLDNMILGHIRDTFRDYYLTDPVRTTIGAMRRLSTRSEPNSWQRNLLNGMEDAIKLGVVSTLDLSQERKTATARMIDKVLGRYRTAKLANLRFTADFTSNMARLALENPAAYKRMTDIMLDSDHTYNKAVEALFPAISDFSSIHGQESITSAKGPIEKFAEKLIGLGDYGPMKASVLTTFENKFKELTGKKFDYKDFLSENSEYADDNKEAIEEARHEAMVAVSKEFVPPSSFAKAGHTKVFPGMDPISKKENIAKLFGFLQSYTVHEAIKTAQAFKDLSMGTNEGRGMALRRILSIQASNMFYMVMMRMMSDAWKEVADDDDDEATEEIGKALTNWTGDFGSLWLGNNLSLLLGRYGSAFRGLYSLASGLAVTALKGSEQEENIQQLNKYVNEGLYTQPITDRSTSADMLRIVPGVGSLASTALKTGTSAARLMSDPKEKDALMLLQGLSLAASMALPNPITPTMEKYFSSSRSSKMDKERSDAQLLDEKTHPGQAEKSKAKEKLKKAIENGDARNSKRYLEASGERLHDIAKEIADEKPKLLAKQEDYNRRAFESVATNPSKDDTVYIDGAPQSVKKEYSNFLPMVRVQAEALKRKKMAALQLLNKIKPKDDPTDYTVYYQE